MKVSFLRTATQRRILSVVSSHQLTDGAAQSILQRPFSIPRLPLSPPWITFHQRSSFSASTAMASQENSALPKFLSAMQSIYGPFPDSTDPDLSSWKPPPAAEGHRGRYLWTDGFAVVNFLTLHRLTQDPRYLTFATNLVSAVHNILGYTRDGKSRLPGATESEPLKGGLRIGKIDETGPDGDGQYFHCELFSTSTAIPRADPQFRLDLTVWMFALNRVTLVTGSKWYNDQAVCMAQAVLPHFMTNPSSKRPRMFWKMSMDLSHPLVMSEGNLDPIDGYVTYKLLQESADDKTVLTGEIVALKKIVDTKWENYSSSDTLDLGMTLWTAHWLSDREEWAAVLSRRAVYCLKQLVLHGYFNRSTARRLAFREFGTALGVRSADVIDDPELVSLPDVICETWEKAGLVPKPTHQQQGRMAELMPITAVMYASALIPGLMSRRR